MENDLYGMFEEDNTALTDYNVYYQQQQQDKEEEGKWNYVSMKDFRLNENMYEMFDNWIIYKYLIINHFSFFINHL